MPNSPPVTRSAVHGVDVYTVAVEVDIQHSQMFAFTVVSLLDTTV